MNVSMVVEPIYAVAVLEAARVERQAGKEQQRQDASAAGHACDGLSKR